MDADESFTIDDSDWEDLEEIEKLNVKSLTSFCLSEPVDHTMNPDFNVPSSNKRPSFAKKQAFKKYKNKMKFSKKGKVPKPITETNIVKSEQNEFDGQKLSEHSSSEDETSIHQGSAELHPSETKPQLSKNPEKSSTYLPEPSFRNATFRKNCSLSESYAKHSSSEDEASIHQFPDQLYPSRIEPQFSKTPEKSTCLPESFSRNAPFRKSHNLSESSEDEAPIHQFPDQLSPTKAEPHLSKNPEKSSSAYLAESFSRNDPFKRNHNLSESCDKHSEDEAPSHRFPYQLYPGKTESELIKNPEKSSPACQSKSFSSNTAIRVNRNLNESCYIPSQSHSEFDDCYIEKNENPTNFQCSSFNTEAKRNICFESDSGSDSDSVKSIFSFKSLVTRPVNEEKHYTKRSTSMFESSTKTYCQIDNSRSKNCIPDPHNSPKMYRHSNENLPKDNWYNNAKKLSSNSNYSKSAMATEKHVTDDQKNKKLNPNQFHFDYQDITKDTKTKKQFFQKEVYYDFKESTVEREELFSQTQSSSDDMFPQTPSKTGKADIFHQRDRNRRSPRCDQSVSADNNDFEENTTRRKELFSKKQSSPDFISPQTLSKTKKADIFLQGDRSRSSPRFISGDQSVSTDNNDFEENTTKRKELFSKKQSSSDFIFPQTSSKPEKVDSFHQENRNRNSSKFISGDQFASTDTNIRHQPFGNNPLSSHSKIESNNISFTSSKEAELSINSLEYIVYCRQKLEKIAENSIDKILLEKEDLSSTYQNSNISVRNVVEKRIHNFVLQQNQFEDVITCAKNQISYSSCRNYHDIVKTWDTIESSVQNECKIFENFFPAYAFRKDIIQSLTHKSVLFLHSNNAYFFNVLVPLIIQKHYPSYFIVSCENDETQKQYLEYSLQSAVGSQEQKHKTYVMTELELLNYSLKKDYAIRKTTCVVLNLSLSRSVVFDILLSNLRDMLNGNKNSKLVFIIDPNVDLTSYKKYFSMFNVSTIKPPILTYPVNTIWKNNPLIPQNDYVNEIVRTILSIHVTKSWGNILAFVPSLRDARTVYQLLKKNCADYLYNDVKIILVDESYYAICNADIHEKKSKFKFVFISVSSAEIITLPSVRFIVDCGIITDYHLDDDKKIDVLGTLFISTTKSKVRKALGGIYGPGMCYRIYSKQNFINDMHSEDYPEVLLRNPLNSLVKILRYKPNTELQNEFIEFLPDDVVTDTIENLEKYGAIVDNKISHIGEKLTKLPFEAKYSKLILSGIDFGVAFETIVLVSFLTEKGKMFKSSDNPKYQRIIDSKQMELVQCQSDTLTNLHIYKTCLQNKFDLEWCKKHYIDDNFLEKVHQRVDEMCKIIFLSLEITISKNFSTDESWLTTIRQIIFECFQDNLCVFSGRLDCGFRVLSSELVAYLPTQSIICQKDDVPQFLIFDHILVSDKNYLISVTSIPSDLVMKGLQDGFSYFSCDELFDNTLTGRTIEPVGEEVMNDVFLGEDDEKLKGVVEQIKQKIDSTLVSIEPSVKKGCVCIYALPTYIDAAYQALNNILKVKFEEIVNECQFHSYELIKDQKSVILEVELSKGAMAKYVKVSNVLVQPLTEANVHATGSVASAIKQSNLLPYSLHVAWIRRHCNGNAIVDFSENTNLTSVRKLCMRNIYLLGMEIFMEMSEKKKNQLCISGLSPEICEEKLMKELKLLLPAAKITGIELVRISPFETSNKRLEAIKSSISNICKNALNMDTTEIVVLKPKPSDLIHEVLIKTDTYEGLDSVADLIIIKFLEDKQNITKIMFNFRIICNIFIYKALQTQLDLTLSQLKNDFKSQDNIKADFEINVDKDSNESYIINIAATNIAVLNLVHETINNLLNGEILTENDIKDLDKMFCHGGHIWLKGLEASENIYIIMNRQMKILRIYGSQKSYENAKKRLIQYLTDIENDVNDIIELSSEKTKNILLKAVVHKYGIDLKKFVEECRLHQAYLDIRSAKLFVYGDQNSVEEASNCIQNLLENLDSVASETILSQETCPVCFCPAINLTYRLEHCGHLYHSEPCIYEFIEKNEDFPMICSAENCGKELVLKDIWKILRNNPERIKTLIKKSIANYLVRHVLDIILCPSTDCSMFFYKSEVGAKVLCALCQNNICIKCHCIEHAGYTCEMYQETKKDADYSYKVWAQTANCKRCPRCQTAIEKTEGCNHMTCRQCSAHFCWLCPLGTTQFWETGQECYAHINRSHPNRLFDYNL